MKNAIRVLLLSALFAVAMPAVSNAACYQSGHWSPYDLFFFQLPRYHCIPDRPPMTAEEFEGQYLTLCLRGDENSAHYCKEGAIRCIRGVFTRYCDYFKNGWNGAKHQRRQQRQQETYPQRRPQPRFQQYPGSTQETYRPDERYSNQP